MNRLGSGVRVSGSFQKNAHFVGRLRSGPRLMGWIGSGPHLVGQIGSEIWVSASCQKNARLVDRLGSGPRFVADRADVVPANSRPADRANVVSTDAHKIWSLLLSFVL